MGRFIKEAAVKVALVGVDKQTAQKLSERLTTASSIDPGTFDVISFAGLAECDAAVLSGRVNAICMAIDKFAIDAVTSFVGNVRVTHPLVPFCLVGTRAFLEEMPGFHKAWRERFRHYYTVVSDVGDDDFSENVGLLRDLLIADSVKCRALGHYDTTPGALVRIQAPRPYGFWTLVAVAFLSALAGGAVSPLLDRLWPAPTALPAQQESAPGKDIER